MKPSILRSAITLLVLLVGISAADTITFNATVGSYGTNQATIGGVHGIAISAYYYNTTTHTWTSATLFGRIQSPSDHGVGICSTGETANCGTGSGGGDFNEISNELHPETLRLALPTGYTWGSVQLSSLDTNSGTGPVEHGILYSSTTGTPGLSGSIGTKICTFAATGTQTCTGTGIGTSAEPTITIPSSFASSPYLFLEAKDLSNSANTNNDFLLYSVVINKVTVPTPEPGSLVLLGSGLLGLAGGVRRKLRS